MSTIDEMLSDKNAEYYDWHVLDQIATTKQEVDLPLLLIHDLNVTSSSYEWNQIVNQLSKTNTVCTIDLLGCGRSDKPWLTLLQIIFMSSLITDFY